MDTGQTAKVKGESLSESRIQVPGPKSLGTLKQNTLAGRCDAREASQRLLPGIYVTDLV